MPDPEGNITAGDANVATPGPTPVAPDIGATPPVVPGAAPSIGERTASSLSTPARPTGQPTFFRQLLFSLGKGLIEGTKAGLEAPLGPQGPSVAATTAIQAPQREREQMTSNKMADLNVAMAQLRLHQMQSIAMTLPQSQQEAMYQSNRDFVRDAIKSKVYSPPLGTGTLGAMQQELARRQADSKDPLPLMIVTDPEGDFNDKDGPSFALVMNERGLAESDTPAETWGASDYSSDPQQQKDFKDSGAGEFRWPGIKEGENTQTANKRYIDAKLKWHIAAENTIKAWKGTQAREAGATERTGKQIASREKIAADANTVKREAIAANNLYRNMKQELDRLKLDQSADKTQVAALGKVVQAAKNVSANQTITAAAYQALSAKERANIQTNRQALDQAQREYEKVSGRPAIGVANAPGRTKFPKGTVATKDILNNYVNLAGGNGALARQWLTEDGATIPPKGQAK